MKPKYNEFTPEEIEDLDDTCAKLAEENSALQDRIAELAGYLRELMADREVTNNVRIGLRAQIERALAKC